MSGEAKVPGVQALQCQFFVQRKKRLCRMTVKPGRQFCGEHEPQPKGTDGEVDRRIPCPNDPKHTCYASKLDKHLKICNARRTEQPAYIVDNINAPTSVEACPRKPLSTIPKDLIMKFIDKVNHLYAKYLEEHIKAEPPQPIHHVVLPEFSEPDRAESSLRHLRQTSALLWIVENEGLVRDGTCYVELGAGKGQLSYYACHAWCGARAGRVLAVDRAPLRHKRDNKLRSAPPRSNTQQATGSAHHVDNTAFKMSEAKLNCSDNISEDITVANTKGSIENFNIDVTNIVETTGDSDNKANSNGITIAHSNRSTEERLNSYVTDITVDGDPAEQRMGNRDNNGCEVGETGFTEEVERGDSDDNEVSGRLRADLAHLALEAVPAVAASTGVVGIAKHLCGVATDYALRCVAAGAETRGVALATCCHHRCERAAYVGTTHLQELGINAEEFNILLGIVSWATCGDGRSRERRATPQDNPDLTPQYPSREEREAVGRRAKALLDWGRVLWLRGRGFQARLCRYVPSAVSLENMCIVAKKR